MDKLFTGELLRLIGFLGLGGISLMAIMGRIIAKIQGKFQPFLKATVVYLLVVGLLCGLAGFLGHPNIFNNPSISFVILQLVFLLLGVLNIYHMPFYLGWAKGENTFWIKVLFSIILCLFGFMFFIIVFKWVNVEGYQYIAGSSIIFFLIPSFVYQTFLKAVEMPPKIFTQWLYPINVTMLEPDEEKLKNMLVISFEFQKKIDEKHFTNFRAKAPSDMDFGQLFYYFINDYNDRHPNGKIEYADKSREPYGWIFYKKPKWYNISTSYIDSEKSFYANRIKENDIIVCKRSLNL
jgi:Type VI secretion system, TssN